MSNTIKILLTGPPGCGKTTAVMKVVGALDKRLRMAGFYTEEIRTAGVRKGFRWQRLDGRTGTLAHVDIKGPHRVSKYGVDVEGFEKDAVSVLDPDARAVDLFVIDEIGKMECFSGKFVEALRRLLDSDRSLLATVAQKGSGLIREVKNHPDVELLHLSAASRDEVTQQAIDRLAVLKAGRR
jgi:nucleoside-triphosphatase